MEFATRDELYKYLKDNLVKLKAEKKAELKHADAVDYVSVKESPNPEFAGKAESSTESIEEGSILAKVVINTTNLITEIATYPVFGKRLYRKIRLLYT